MSDTTWTPEQMREEADLLTTLRADDKERLSFDNIDVDETAAMLRQGAADRERVTALEAEHERLKAVLTQMG